MEQGKPNETDVIRYRVSPWPLVLGGIAMAIVTVPILLVGVFRIWEMLRGPGLMDVQFGDLMILLGIVTCGGMAWFALGLAWRRPVGLRLDEQGLSGYFAPTLAWTDIQSVEKRMVHRGSGVAVKLTPEAVKRRRAGASTAWQRLKMHGGEVFINTTQLRTPIKQILKDMDAYLAQNRTPR